MTIIEAAQTKLLKINITIVFIIEDESIQMVQPSHLPFQKMTIDHDRQIKSHKYSIHNIS